ncbi:MAG: polysaccharide biosynthesis/export family protein, partial [Proteobacteria bacterium]|nr:polysaccharide biosynthesis/export family protein [Pseudomonadota bacterium]
MLRLPFLAIVAVVLATTALLAASLGQPYRSAGAPPLTSATIPPPRTTSAGEATAADPSRPAVAREAEPAPLPYSSVPSRAPERTSAPAAAGPTNPASDISNVERLTIKFQGYGDLSGDYRIGADGTIAIPVLGRISVNGLSVEQLEHQLTNLVTQATGRESFVTVEVAEYHPVLVAGRVGKPGSAPWRPNMTVLHAIALTGGLQRDVTLSGALGEKTAADLKRGLAALARLDSEMKDRRTIDIPPRLLEIAGQNEAEQLVAAQMSILQSHVTAFNDQLSGISRNEKLLKQEIAALDEQSQRLGEQLAVRQDLLKRLEGLIERGHVVNDRLINERVNIATLQEKISATTVARTKAQSQLQAASQDIQKATVDRRAAIDAEKNKLERNLAKFEIVLKSNGETA